MCTNYTPPQQDRLLKMAGMPQTLEECPAETYPMMRAPVLLSPAPSSTGAQPQYRVDYAVFGLITSQYREREDALKRKNTQNARSETIDTLWSYKGPWRKAQFALIPMENFYEWYYGPDRMAKKPVRWEIYRKDREMFTVAAIWDKWVDRQTGESVLSYSMITINSDNHPVMGKFHKHPDEARSVVVIPPELRAAWLQQKTPEHARDFFKEMPADEFASGPAPAAPRTKKAKPANPPDPE